MRHAGGANAPWLHEYNETLRGRVGQAAEIAIIELEHAKDVSDWFARGHSEVELISIVVRKGATR